MLRRWTIAGLLVLGLVGAGAAFAGGGVSVTGPDGQSETLSGLEGLPRISFTVDQHGTLHTFEGAPLNAILARVGAAYGEKLKGPELATIVMVTCADGYQVALALTDTDPGTVKARVILADRMDGRPLPASDGPFRLVVENDVRPARAARRVERIEVRRLATPRPAAR